MTVDVIGFLAFVLQRDAIVGQVDTSRNESRKPSKAHTQVRNVIPPTQANNATQAQTAYRAYTSHKQQPTLLAWCFLLKGLGLCCTSSGSPVEEGESQTMCAQGAICQPDERRVVQGQHHVARCLAGVFTALQGVSGGASEYIAAPACVAKKRPPG